MYRVPKNVFKNKIITLLFLRMNSRWTLDPTLWRKMHGSKPPNLVVWRIVSLRGFLIFRCFYNIFSDSPPKFEGNTMCYFQSLRRNDAIRINSCTPRYLNIEIFLSHGNYYSWEWAADVLRIDPIQNYDVKGNLH